RFVPGCNSVLPFGASHSSRTSTADTATRKLCPHKENGMRLLRILAGAILVSAAAACSDGPAEPLQAAASRPRALVGLPLVNLITGVHPLLRTQDLSSAISVSVEVTPDEGGTLSIPAAGLTIVVPPGAVSNPTVVTVTAVAGRDV